MTTVRQGMLATIPASEDQVEAAIQSTKKKVLKIHVKETFCDHSREAKERFIRRFIDTLHNPV